MSALKDNEKSAPRIGVYRIEEEIGAGAMGKVYRATHETLGKAVALKIVHSDDPTGEVAVRFLQEGIAASRVRHPNVVEILDAGRHEDTAYLAMQLLEGETLAQCLIRQGRLPQTYAVDLILPVCAALSAAHDAGVLHRDLKPANIFLADVGRGDPEPILLDFGISKILGPVDPELTQNPKFLGTPLYIAPEQADGAPGSPLSDQYSLALTLYETLLSVRPFAKYSASLIQLLRHVAEGNIRRAREFDASIPDDLDSALARALSTDPRDRFTSVREFGATLLPFASQARRTLWQQSFTEAERTMTSANAPVSDSTRSSRRVQVSVDSVPPTDPNALDIPATDETSPDDEPGEFLTHSSLFGDADTDSLAGDFERSSISRRDPYSQLPSERLSGDWDERERATAPSLDRNSAALTDTRTGRSPSARTWTLVLTALLFGLALLVAFRPWAASAPATFVVEMSVEPDGAHIFVDGSPVGEGHFRSVYPIDGKVHEARFELAGHEPQTVMFRDHPPARSFQLKQLELPQPASSNREVKAGSVPPSPQAQPEVSPPSATPPRAPASALAEPAVISRAPASPHSVPVSAPTPLSVPSPRPTSAAAKNEEERKEPDAPEPAAPAVKPEGKKPKFHTGNLDPWAK